jgi:hypothetical protein
MSFFEIISHNTLDQRIDRLAYKLAETGIEPGLFIQDYLDKMSHKGSLLTEGWIGNFFKRIGKAWRAFWEPLKDDDPNQRLATAREALTALAAIVKDNSADNKNLQVVLNGIEQSLNIINRVDPYVKQFNQDMVKTRQGQGSFMLTGQRAQLPEDQQEKYMQIMQTYDQIMRQPDSQQKLQQLMAHDLKFREFMKSLEEMYQNPNLTDQEYKQKLGDFLRLIDTDAAFNEIKTLLDFARQRTDDDNELLKQRPAIANAVRSIYRYYSAQLKNNMDQVRNAMLQWYAKLPDNNEVKQFIHEEMRTRPGSSEQELFWAYAQYWFRTDKWHMQDTTPPVQLNQPQRA